MAELAEGARLLSEYGAKVPSRVRIPLSPPPNNMAPATAAGCIFLQTYPKYTRPTLIFILGAGSNQA